MERYRPDYAFSGQPSSALTATSIELIASRNEQLFMSSIPQPAGTPVLVNDGYVASGNIPNVNSEL